MDKLTLDTNVLRDWAWVSRLTDEIRYGGRSDKREEIVSIMSRLINARDSNLCEFGVTTQIYTDYESDVGELPDYVETLLGSFVPLATPSISVFPMTLPFVFADVEEIESILYTVFDTSNSLDNNYNKHRKDALQLYAHKVASRDYFLTNDRAILRASSGLGEIHAIQVMSPIDYWIILTH